MKKYLHYGEEVFYQVTEKSFKNHLRSNNISYTDLPIEDYDIIVYDKDNQRRFACILKCNTPDEYYEKVIITKQIPLDANWDKLVGDILAQVNGANPMKMETKAHMLCLEAEKLCLENEEPSDDFTESLCQKEIKPWEFSLALSTLGYSTDELLEMDHHDVNEEYLKFMCERK